MAPQHNSPLIKKIFRNLEKKGFIIEKRKRCFKINPPTTIGGSPYFTHGTDCAYHKIRNDFELLYKIDITSP
jgi:sugar-specific transcriptional regulator TrmB